MSSVIKEVLLQLNEKYDSDKTMKLMQTTTLLCPHYKLHFMEN